MKTVAVIGTGDVGKTLAAGFLKHGYAVVIGTRDPSKMSEWIEKTGGKATTKPLAEAAASADIILLAVLGSAGLDALEAIGAANIKGKLVLDATNPVKPVAPTGGVIGYENCFEESLMEKYQKAFPEAHFVKGFSCMGFLVMVNPDFGGEKASMFYCGDNEGAKAEAAKIFQQFGHDLYDCGPCAAARALEGIVPLWVLGGINKGSWNHAFKIIQTKH